MCAGRDEVIERRLRDGSTFRVIKNFVDPQELELRLRRLGWDGTIRRDGSDWVYGEASPIQSQHIYVANYRYYGTATIITRH